MTLDEFVASAPAMLEAFAHATRERAKADVAMDPNCEREPEWWWRDVAAYIEVVDIEELERNQRGRWKAT